MIKTCSKRRFVKNVWSVNQTSVSRNLCWFSERVILLNGERQFHTGFLFRLVNFTVFILSKSIKWLDRDFIYLQQFVKVSYFLSWRFHILMSSWKSFLTILKLCHIHWIRLLWKVTEREVATFFANRPHDERKLYWKNGDHCTVRKQTTTPSA